MEIIETLHAKDRRCQREIKENWITLCRCKGMRINIPPNTIEGVWLHKHMYHGLHVISDAHSGVIITAYWAVQDVDALAQCKDFYAREVFRRNETAALAKTSVRTRKRIGQKGVNKNKNKTSSFTS